jgi:hypothetical protein
LLLASGGVTHYILTPPHFLTARLSCYVCGPTRQVSAVALCTKWREKKGVIDVLLLKSCV